VRIKLFEKYVDQSILDEVDQCLVDLTDNGFTCTSSLKEGWSSYILNILINKDDGFKINDIKESLEVMIDYFVEKYNYNPSGLGLICSSPQLGYYNNIKLDDYSICGKYYIKTFEIKMIIL